MDQGARSHVTAVSSSQLYYVSFGVGAVAVTLLSVVVSALTVDSSSPTYLLHTSTDVSLKHRRSPHGTTLLNDTVLNDTLLGMQNDTVPTDSTHSDTVLDAQNDTVPTNVTDSSQWSKNVSSNVSATTANMTTTTNHTTTTTNTSSATTTTTSHPHKPKFLDASKLTQDRGVADGSNFRNKIREKLGDIPADVDNVPSVSATTTTTTPVSLLLHSVRPASTSHSSSSSSSSMLTVSRSQSDSDVSPPPPVSATNISSLSTSSEIAQEIVNELVSLITSDRLSDHRTDDYSTATTAAAAEDDDDDDTSTNSSSVSNPPTSPVLPAAAAAVSDGGSVYSLVSSPVTATLHNTPDQPRSPSTQFHTRSSSVAAVSPAPTVTDTTTVGLSRQPAAAVTVSAAGGTLLLSTTPTVTSSSSAAAAAAGVVAEATDLYCEIVLLTVAVTALLVSLMMFVLMSSRCVSTVPANPQPPRHPQATDSRQRHPVAGVAATSVVGALLYFFQSAMEWTYTGLMVDFAASVLAWSRTQSVLLVFLYWLGHALGRALCVYFLARQVRPWPLLLSGALLAAVSSLVMWVGTVTRFTVAGDALVWFSSAVFGLSTSVVLPTSHRVIPPSTATSLSVLLTTLSGGLGQASAPAVAAVLADVRSSPSVVVKLIFVAAVAVAALSVLLRYVVSRRNTAGSGNYSSHLRLLEDGELSPVDGVEVASDGMMPADDEDEDEEEEDRSELLNEAETSLINNNPPSSSSSSRQTFVRHASSGYSKHD